MGSQDYSNGGQKPWNLTAFRGRDRDGGSHDEHRHRQQLYGPPALSPFLYFHGMLFTSWVVLFVTQTALGRREAH